jgi:hypothetical protein
MSHFGGIIMASAAQTAANRANAQKSTGPRTPEGKALVAQNAIKHGLLAQRDVIPGEDPGEFALFRDRMREDLDPTGTLEGMLADRVVHLAWRLRRAERLESTALSMLEDRQVAKATGKPAEGDNQDDREAVLARAAVEDFRYGKVLDRLLGYERRIENSLYRTMNELRKQRLIREVSEEVARVKWEVSGEQSQLPGAPDEKVCGAHPTGETPYGVTTNGAEKGDESRQTKPVDVGSLEDQRSCAEIQEIGRGRPSYEETPDGVTTNGAQEVERVCQTKPEEVTGDKWQVTSQEAPEPGASELPTSNVRLQTTDTLCETKPICVSGSEDRGPGAEMPEVGRGRPSHEEAPFDGTQHSNLPSFQDSSSLAGPSGETKPKEVTSEKSQVTSQPG